MDAQTAISTAMTQYDNISSSDADNTSRRARYLQFLQETVDEIWIGEDWTFSYLNGTVSFSAGSDKGSLPADFMEFGLVGGIWDPQTLSQVPEIRPVSAYGGVVEGLSGESQGVVSQFGNDTTAVRRTLRLRGQAGSTVVYPILYRKIAPTITDAADGGTGASNLWQIPVQYHNTVIMPLFISKIRKSHGDSREYMDRYLQNYPKMVERERSRKTTTQYMPMADNVRW